MRTFAYIDGFNLYYRCVRRTPYKWLNLRALFEGLLRPQNQLERICYYTARVSGRDDPEAPKRQHAYLRAIETIPEVSIHYGKFLPKIINRPLADESPPTFAQVHAIGKDSSLTKKIALANPHAPSSTFVNVRTTEEKGSDVNLASHLIRDGFQGAYDVAVVLSNDTDLVEPMRIIAQELRKPLGLITPVGNPSPHLAAVATFTRRITRARLAKCQLPNSVIAKNGKRIDKPSTW